MYSTAPPLRLIDLPGVDQRPLDDSLVSRCLLFKASPDDFEEHAINFSYCPKSFMRNIFLLSACVVSIGQGTCRE
jgi:hypothetical protein